MDQKKEIPDCSYSIDGELVTISQDGHGNDDFIVTIHKSHIQMIAGEFGLIGRGDALWRLVAAIHEARRRAEHCAVMVEKVPAGQVLTLEEEAVSALLDYLDGVIAMLPEQNNLSGRV
ncbi:MAG: hypothetical protein WA056_10060 [Gallionella sp.]